MIRARPTDQRRLKVTMGELEAAANRRRQDKIESLEDHIKKSGEEQFYWKERIDEAVQRDLRHVKAAAAHGRGREPQSDEKARG